LFVWNNGILNLVWNNVILKISFPFLPLESSGVSKYRLCSLAQYINLVGVTIGYTITTAISMGYAFFFFFLPDSLTLTRFNLALLPCLEPPLHTAPMFHAGMQQPAGRALSLF